MDRNLHSYWFKASQKDGVKDKEAAANKSCSPCGSVD